MLRDPENIESQFLHNLLGPSAGTVLEVGCGDGRLTAELAKISDNILGLEPDPASIEKARYLEGGRVRFIQGSGHEIPASKDSFDTVVFSLSLHHHTDPGSALMEARRVLKDGGRILVLEPEAEAPTNKLYSLIHYEDDAYEKAAAAIFTSGLTADDKGAYETLWRFDDFLEMVEYLFGYFEMEPDPGIVDDMALLLGGRCDSKPLDMVDITRYWLLRPNSSRDQDQVP